MRTSLRRPLAGSSRRRHSAAPTVVVGLCTVCRGVTEALVVPAHQHYLGLDPHCMYINNCSVPPASVCVAGSIVLAFCRRELFLYQSVYTDADPSACCCGKDTVRRW